MTRKEIENVKYTLPKWNRGIPPVLTSEQKKLDKELSCRDMINSILCYHGTENIIDNRYLQSYIKELGHDTVERLCNEQIADFEKAYVKRGIGPDSEGCYYNAIIWADDM